MDRMIFLWVNMLECRVKFYDGAVDGVMSESSPDIVYCALQHLQLLTF